MSLTRLALHFSLPVPDIEGYQRYLFIGPHPDDIEIGAGATAAKLASQGKDVCFLICTDGRYGDDAAPEGIRGEALAKLRRKEALRSAAVLGVKDVRFLNLRDGAFYEMSELIHGVAEVVGSFRPDVIFAPDPCVKSESHADHLNVGCAARQIAYFAPYKSIMSGYGVESAPVKALAYYMTADFNLYVKTSGFIQRQFDAIFNCHLSQFPQNSSAAKSLAIYLKLRAYDNGLRGLKGCAEGFRVLGETQMHCIPEA